MKKYAVGTDVGGNHISCALVDLSTGKIVDGSRSEGSVDNRADKVTILESWASVLKKTIKNVDKRELAGIGFGMPGPFEYHKGIARFAQVEKYYSLNGVGVADELDALLGIDVPLRFMNDASAFAVGEAWQGCVANFGRSVSITLGTGFGSAFVANGVPVVNGNDVPEMGCVWHLPYADGIADDYFSTRWFLNEYKKITGVMADGVRQLADAAITDRNAITVFTLFGYNLGNFLAPWLLKFGTSTLVIGGKVAEVYSLFGTAFEFAFLKHGIAVKIKLPILKDDAAIIGSARLIDENYWQMIQPGLSGM